MNLPIANRKSKSATRICGGDPFPGLAVAEIFEKYIECAVKQFIILETGQKCVKTVIDFQFQASFFKRDSLLRKFPSLALSFSMVKNKTSAISPFHPHFVNEVGFPVSRAI